MYVQSLFLLVSPQLVSISQYSTDAWTTKNFISFLQTWRKFESKLFDQIYLKASAKEAPLYMSRNKVSLWWGPSILSHMRRLWIRIASRSPTILFNSSLVATSVEYWKLALLGIIGFFGKGWPSTVFAFLITIAARQYFSAVWVSLCSSKKVAPINSFASANRSGE